ncbi:MAG TPA: hypothetical protein DCF84_06640 [Bacteroidetes bacterium]|nr:hypothetical protein [Bacteroidota bacterium]|tara:strand:+ start:4511 stop:5275 length:765 start_codon:yes stop_codon:yes gene_type:complete
MKNSKVYATAVWISILAIIVLSFIGLRFTNNVVHARHLEDEGQQEVSLSLYAHVLSTEAKTLDDSLAVIGQSNLLGVLYRERWATRFDNIMYQLSANATIDTNTLSRASSLMQFLIDYDITVGKMDDEAVVSEHRGRIDALCERYIAHTDEILSQGLQPQNVMASVRIYKNKVLQYNPYQVEALSRLYFLTGLSGQSKKQEEYFLKIKDYLSMTFQDNPENGRLFLENLLSLQSVNFDYTILVNRLAQELNIYL